MKKVKEKKEVSIKPWDINSHLNVDKVNKWDYYKGFYNAYLTNKFFSYHPDTLFFANEMNKAYKLTNEEQYLFYLYAITYKKKRFSKFHKAEKINNEITALMEKYSINKEVAKQYLKIQKTIE